MGHPLHLFNGVTNRLPGRLAAPGRGLAVLAALLVAGCGGSEPEATRYVPATAATESRQAAPANAERDARPARNIATH